MDASLKRHQPSGVPDADYTPRDTKRARIEDASDLTCFSPNPSQYVSEGVAPRTAPLLRQETKRRKVKVLSHYVELSELEWRIVDTPHFASKRNVKQLGASIYAFPCATETRWMHQLLVRHFSNMVICLLREHQPELGITERWIQAINIAALCHDIGHVCFSHLADAELFRSFVNIPEAMRDHESRGILLFEWMNRHYEFGIDSDQVLLIQWLITGDSVSGMQAGYPGWLFDIVNARNTFDVDKVVYLETNAIASHGHVRDLQAERIFTEQRVLDDEICHPRKMHRLILDVLHHRKLAFAELYRHKLMAKCEAILICIFRHMAKALDWEKLLMKPEEDGHKWCLVLTDAAIDSLPALVNNPAVFDRFSAMQQHELGKAYALYVRLETRKWFATKEQLALVTPGEPAEMPTTDLADQPDTFSFEYTVGYSNNPKKNPIDRIHMFSATASGDYKLETLRTVLEAEQGTNAYFERHRIVIFDEDS